MDTKLVWVGVRESDIEEAKALFYKSITIHGSNQNGNISMEYELKKRYNHNGEILEYDYFFQNTMFKILEKEPDCRFVLYDSLDSKNFCDELKDKICFSNSLELLDFIDDKILLKIWAMEFVDLLPYKIYSNQELTNNVLEKKFSE